MVEMTQDTLAGADEVDYTVCSCPLQGYCPKFRREMSFNEWRKCNSPGPARSAMLRKFFKADSLSVRAFEDRHYPPLCTMPVEFSTSVRHLNYFIYPLAKHSDKVWRRQLELLGEGKSAINGKSIVRIVTGGGCSSISEVTKAVVDLGLPNLQIVYIRNNRDLREVNGFIPSIAPLETLNPNEYIFFAHAKGVTHDDKSTAHRWSEIMYQTLYFNWPAVLPFLNTYGCLGSFKRYGEFNVPNSHRWHYSGTFYWVRSASLFARDWQMCCPTTHGTESYLGMHFRPSEAGCVFMDLCENVYDTTYFRDVVEKEFAVWASKSLKLPATVAEYERFLEKSHKFNLPRGI